MAERDMTGEDHQDRADGSPLARRRGDHPRIGRLGFERLGGDLGGDLGGELRGLAGGGGDLANLPPWSVRDEAGRPDRDPVALAAWRRVAERRRLRAAAAADEAAADEAAAEEAAAVPEPAEPVVEEPPVEEPAVEEPVAEEPAPEDVADTDDADTDDAGEAVDEVPAPPAVPAARDAHAEPPERPAGPARTRGSDFRPGTPSSVRPDGGGRHEVLLSLAGRIDDDALSSVRELVAVEDDAAAAELLGGSLLAAGAGVTPREHAVLGRWFASSRVDPELVDVLPRDPEADRRDEHRFTGDPPPGAAASGGAGEAVARAAARLPEVHRVRQCWRTTPAGAAPGPVPHRVVLVETHSADDCEHVAHHVAHAARELGAVSVEVFAAGAELPAYHQAAVRAARPLPAAATPRSGAPAATPRSGAPAGGHARRDHVPPFGVPGPPAPSRASVESSEPRAEPARREPAAEPVLPVEPTGRAEPVGSSEPAEEEYRTVAAAGRDPLERPDRAVPDIADVEDAPAPSAPQPETLAAEPEGLEPPAPPPVDLDPETTAERIAALWRTPPPDEILSDEHPISAWTGSPLGVSFGTDGPAAPGTAPAETTDDRAWEPPAAVDPDAATGDIPVVGGSLVGDLPAVEPDAVNGARLRRARHSRSETGEFEAPLDAPAPTHTNGHHHGPEHGDGKGHGRGHGPGDAATGPVHRPRPSPSPPAPEPPAPAAPSSAPPSGPDSVDSQLSERERELLARLHEELASRERLEAGAPDPLTGRPSPGQHAPPGSEDTTAPRPRPTGPPHPGPRPSGPPPVGGSNGHNLPRRGDHDGEDGTPRDA
ncbi:hypothetical protein [Actinomycetospora cinnamomea]|uniref:Uncharacterized protein n=1 Tax=Actinomycetospora cinnamomea TaxID=663609 RepID=A0A2U1FB59_9PSEU|nr:hypothetical protein [Actinomycetospora cinnamomea]PVZ09404.1 hypothetical protein C8D89_10660 [Actinomycetospora cinnamomea]